jgi:hypothetical protein
MVAFKQPHSLGNLLVWAEIATHNTTIGKSHSCGEKCCKYCRHMQHSSSYTSKVTGKQYNIFVLLIARVQILFTSLSVPFMTSIFILLKSSRLFSDSPKCWLTGRNGFFVRSLLCPFRRLWKGCLDSVYDNECCICLRHLQCLSPQE